MCAKSFYHKQGDSFDLKRSYKLVGFNKKDFDENYAIKNLCWIWNGIKNKGGYGLFYYKKKYVPAHRHSYYLKFGEIEKGKLICHHCDNPPCVNPDHLFIGTHKDNTLDMISKGRGSNQKKTHCRHGHEYTKENTFLSNRGVRSCRICIKRNILKRKVGSG